MANLDDGPIALRTPLYLIVAGFGLIMFIAVFLEWASAAHPETSALSLSVSGTNAGGWGLGAIVAGLAILALGILGYLWNPFSDPEAIFIGAISLAVLVGALVKMADTASLFSDSEALFEFFDASTSAGVGLWLVLLTALASFLSAVWILFSRPRAESRLV